MRCARIPKAHPLGSSDQRGAVKEAHREGGDVPNGPLAVATTAGARDYRAVVDADSCTGTDLKAGVWLRASHLRVVSTFASG